MKILNHLLPIALLLVASNALAQSFPKDKVRQIEQNSIEVAQRYAERTGKPMPQIQDYRYSMKLDIAKVVYQSPRIEYCGVIPQIMVFEDSNEELRSIRYRSQGECRSQR
ncbi:hypothetical protein FIV02_23280 [Pseudomonas sp. THAF187a]|nr:MULTISPECIES: DUF2790 domain-containing protein [unclassified Pseudomonas]QFT24493.1 hypothetical protein FIV02_23280 [Pseudomonas sp. THAF187a]QFT44680.1 hypothetical protein FIU98_23260 [Pseudomonas sp. THAF42]TNF11874.1 MAG: DUF2790 domain-containing protein [Pseudomonadales bacterium]